MKKLVVNTATFGVNINQIVSSLGLFLIYILTMTLLFSSCQKDALEDMDTLNEPIEKTSLQNSTESIVQGTTDGTLFPNDTKGSIRIENLGNSSRSRTDTVHIRTLLYSKVFEVGFQKWNQLYYNANDLPNSLENKIEVYVIPIHGNPDLYIHGYDNQRSSPYRTIRSSTNPGTSVGGITETTSFRRSDLLRAEEQIYMNVYGASAAKYEIKIYMIPVDCKEYPPAEQGFFTHEADSPVCGCNGKTYPKLSAAINFGITSWKSGACKVNDSSTIPKGHPYTFTVGDVNGDKKSDFVMIYETPAKKAGIWLRLSNGRSFQVSNNPQVMAGFSTKQRWLSGDFNGDGKVDLVNIYGYQGKAKAWLHLSTGNGFEYNSGFNRFAGYSESQRWLVGDFNGDGMDDLVNVYGNKGKARAWLHFSTGKGFEYKSGFTEFAGFWDAQKWLAGDFNGDGKDDLVNVYGNKGKARAWVHLSRGNGFDYKSSFTEFAGFSNAQKWLTGDFNGDGKDDLVNVYGNKGKARAWVHLSRGIGFDYKSSFTVFAGFWNAQKWITGDFNGDGKDDLINVYQKKDEIRGWSHFSTGNGFTYKSNLQTLASIRD